jgi:hypothetical protein
MMIGKLLHGQRADQGRWPAFVYDASTHDTRTISYWACCRCLVSSAGGGCIMPLTCFRTNLFTTRQDGDIARVVVLLY